MFQSLLLQVSFKTAVARCVGNEIGRFNPFSFRSPSKRRTGGTGYQSFVSIPSPSGLLQNAGYHNPAQWTVSIPSPSGLLQNGCLNDSYTDSRFNPFSFRSPSKRCSRLSMTLAGFQSLLLQVSFKTERTAESWPSLVSIPSPSGLLQNNYGPWIMPGTEGVSIPSPSGLLQNETDGATIRR